VTGDTSQKEESALARVAAAHRTSRIIVLAFAASVVIYTVIGIALGEGRAERGARAPFLLAGLVLALGSMAVRRAQLGRMRLEAVARRRGARGLVRHIFITTLVSSALAEAAGVLGLVSGLLGGSQLEVIILGVIGLMMVLSNYPRRSAWEDAVEHFATTLPQ
jgi:F0F1-type ATP synthase membrane subunit c/vacuolar-type H+-ATPase subunit K